MGSSLSMQVVADWQTACAQQFSCASDGLVDRFGQVTFPNCSATNSSLPADVWGITAEMCYQHCGSDTMTQAYDFTSISITLSTWLFPFIALIAQLPFEARDTRNNFLSGCLSLGSPTLVTYSLALTVLNRSHIASEFSRLKKEMLSRTSHVSRKFKCVSFVLAEVQHAPMRGNQQDNWLNSLICLEKNSTFWRKVASNLKKTRRGFSMSFFAQIFFAFLAYLFAFIAAVHDSLGSTDVGLQFATSIVWSWMFPVIFGCIHAGSQYRAGTIRDALDQDAIREDDETHAQTSYPRQMGLIQSADLYLCDRPCTIERSSRHSRRTISVERRGRHPHSQPHLSGQTFIPSHASSDSRPTLSATLNLGAPTSPETASYMSRGEVLSPDPDTLLSTESELFRCERPTIAGFEVGGDEGEEGSIFNYARTFTWFQLAYGIRNGFENALRSPPARNSEDWPTITTYESLENSRFKTFQDIRRLPAVVFHNMFWSAFVALILQWGTTGAAIFTAYNTPPIGLGCRSGSFVLYGILATTIWLLLVVSAVLSHVAMNYYEDHPEEIHEPSSHIKRISFLAVSLRWAGKALAILNTAWLFSFSIMQDIGFFQNCWCQTNALSIPMERSWIAVFTDASDLRGAASGVWSGGFALSTTCFFGIGAFFYFSA